MEEKPCLQQENLKQELVQLRRCIHEFAEISGCEIQTSKLVQTYLQNLGLTMSRVSKTGLLAVLDTGRVGACIALRADMDALPMPEEPNNLAGPRSCISKNPSTCHACGHDAHTAMLLVAARLLVESKQELCGKICFCFEEGEENGAGIQGMLQALETYQVDTCWTMHVYAGLDSGHICVDAGPRMAGAAGIEMKIIGKGGHGSRPDMAANPVFCAASVVTNAATAWVNQISAEENVTLGITGIKGGNAPNIIDDTATIQGSMRFFNLEEGQKAVKLFQKVAENTAKMNDCRAESGPRMKVLIGPVINDDFYACLAKNALSEALPEGTVCHCPPWYASESFSAYAKRYPSVMAHLGIRNLEKGCGAAHHNSFFDVDEDVLPLGLQATLLYVQAVQRYWKKTEK